jgi:hypothetical protein
VYAAPPSPPRPGRDHLPDPLDPPPEAACALARPAPHSDADAHSDPDAHSDAHPDSDAHSGPHSHEWTGYTLVG